MQRIIVKPEDLDLESRGRRDYWVRLEHDTNWAEWHIPLTVWCGGDAEPGRGLVATGSNHGNEYEGPVGLKHLLGEIRTDDVTGRIIIIPVLNPAAFRAGTRESTRDDGVNLNRAFVPGAGETPALNGITHRIAKFVRDAIWPQVHIVLDMHAGGQVAQFVHCTSFHEIPDPEQNRLVRETAAWYGTPVVSVYQDGTPGLLPSEGERLGKITVGSELGWGESVDPMGVKYCRQGVLAAAINHGQLRGTIQPFGHHADGTQLFVDATQPECWLAAPWPGHYESLVPCGAAVRAGDTVGLLHDFYRLDEPGWPVRSAVDGIILAQAYGARVEAGQHILVVGRRRD